MAYMTGTTDSFN